MRNHLVFLLLISLFPYFTGQFLFNTVPLDIFSTLDPNNASNHIDSKGHLGKSSKNVSLHKK